MIAASRAVLLDGAVRYVVERRERRLHCDTCSRHGERDDHDALRLCDRCVGMAADAFRSSR